MNKKQKIWVQKLSWVLSVLGFGMVLKKPSLLVLGSTHSMLGTKICLYWLIFHQPIEEDHIYVFYIIDKLKKCDP